MVRLASPACMSCLVCTVAACTRVQHTMCLNCRSVYTEVALSPTCSSMGPLERSVHVTSDSSTVSGLQWQRKPWHRQMNLFTVGQPLSLQSLNSQVHEWSPSLLLPSRRYGGSCLVAEQLAIGESFLNEFTIMTECFGYLQKNVFTVRRTEHTHRHGSRTTRQCGARSGSPQLNWICVNAVIRIVNQFM